MTLSNTTSSNPQMPHTASTSNANGKRRGKDTSYKARLTSLSAVKNEGDSALLSMREDRALLVKAGNDTYVLIGKMLNDLQRIIASRAGDAWCVNEDGSPVVVNGTELRSNNVLLADTQNVWAGIKMLERIIVGQDRSIESLIEHADELAESIRPRTLTKMRSLVGVEIPLGFNKPQYDFSGLVGTARNEKGLEQPLAPAEPYTAHDDDDEQHDAEHVISATAEPPQYETTPRGTPVSTASAAAAAGYTPRYNIRDLH